jgi:2-polyprenyl-3-methyl-5-hydroxy-6-metoxy-1,4-benzoquinol methylase
VNLDSINNEFYNEYADSFDKIPFEEKLTDLLLKYVSKPKSQVLEIGSGAGALAKWMTKLGHNLTCIEPAEKAAVIARKRGLKVFVKRFQDFYPDTKYDIILAISSLIHIQRSEIPSQLKKISESLQKNGVVFATFIEGEGEGYEDPTGKGKKRFFSKYSESELQELLSPYFSIIECEKIDVKKMNQSFFLMVLRSSH